MSQGTSRKRAVLCDADGTPLATRPSAAGPVLLLRDAKTLEMAELVFAELRTFLAARTPFVPPDPWDDTITATAAWQLTQGDHGKLVLCDTTNGGFTVSLPYRPFTGYTVTVLYATVGGTNTVTISAGNDLVNGVSTGLLLTRRYDVRTLRHAGQGVWYATSPGAESLSGAVLGANFTGTIETTTSTSAADLATVQSLAFVLEAAADVVVGVGATHANNTASAVNRLHVTVDGTPTTVAQSICDTGNVNYSMANEYVASALAAGSHTIKLQFSVNAGTGTFSNRSVSVWRK